MVTFSRFVLCCAYLFALCAVRADGPRAKEVLATDSDVEKLPLYGVIHVHDSDETEHRIDLGESFVGRIHQGKVSVTNNGSHAVVLGQLISSCGCALAQPTDDEIPAGEMRYLLIQIVKRAVGPFEETVNVAVAGRRHRIVFAGKTIPRISSRDTLTIDETGSGNVTLMLHDEALNPSEMTFSVQGSQFQITNLILGLRSVEISLRRTGVAILGDAVQIVPIASRDDRTEAVGALEPISIPVSYLNVVRAVPATVYVSGHQNVRIFLMGDVRSIMNSLNVTTAGREGSAVLRIRVSSETSGAVCNEAAVAAVGALSRGVSFTFQLPKVPRGDYQLAASCKDLEFTVRLKVFPNASGDEQ